MLRNNSNKWTLVKALAIKTQLLLVTISKLTIIIMFLGLSLNLFCNLFCRYACLDSATNCTSKQQFESQVLVVCFTGPSGFQSNISFRETENVNLNLRHSFFNHAEIIIQKPEIYDKTIAYLPASVHLQEAGIHVGDIIGSTHRGDNFRTFGVTRLGWKN